VRLIHVRVLPFAVTFELVDITECGLHYDEHGGEANKAHEKHKNVRGSEERPGFHVWFVTVFIIAPFSGKAKGG
jgi:hypothetical protein